MGSSDDEETSKSKVHKAESSDDEETEKSKAHKKEHSKDGGTAKSKAHTVETGDEEEREHEVKPVGRLEARLIQAHGLTNKDFFGKSDPFAQLYIGPKHKAMKTSRVVNNDLNPIWNEYFEFEVQDPSTQHLAVKIYDDDGLQSSEILGCTHIELSELEPGEMKELWLSLVKDLEIQGDHKNRGKVQLELLYCPYGVENGETKKRKVIIRGVLSVTVISCEDLPPADLMGKADPYVVLTMKKTGTKHKTKVVYEELNPIWNETFDFVVEDGLHDMLILEIWDHDTFGKDFMGKCILTLTRVILEGEYEDSFPVDGAKTGKINLKLKWLAQTIYRNS